MKHQISSYVAMTLVLLNLTGCRSSEISSTSVPKEAQKQEPVSWIGNMRELQKSLDIIEPLIFDSKQFVHPKNQSLLKFTIQGLADQSKSVSHNPTLISRDPTVRYVAAHFAEDLKQTNEAFISGKTDFARYRLLKVTSYCVECHTRMQQGPDYRFRTNEAFLKKLAAPNQIEFLIANRQYDQAFEISRKTLEANRRGSPLAWEIDKVARLGLQVAVQFKDDPTLTEKLLATIEKNPDSPLFLKDKVAPWKLSLQQWKLNPGPYQEISEVRNLIKKRQSEVDDMRAISNLLQLLSRNLKNDELGEVLFLTGQSYENLNDVTPMALNENYYESCIRQVPHSTWSKKCYKSLESSIRLGYTGSGGMRIPLGVQVHLDILRKEAE